MPGHPLAQILEETMAKDQDGQAQRQPEAGPDLMPTFAARAPARLVKK